MAQLYTLFRIGSEAHAHPVDDSDSMNAHLESVVAWADANKVPLKGTIVASFDVANNVKEATELARDDKNWDALQKKVLSFGS